MGDAFANATLHLMLQASSICVGEPNYFFRSFCLPHFMRNVVKNFCFSKNIKCAGNIRLWCWCCGWKKPIWNLFRRTVVQLKCICNYVKWKICSSIDTSRLWSFFRDAFSHFVSMKGNSEYAKMEGIDLITSIFCCATIEYTMASHQVIGDIAHYQ